MPIRVRVPLEINSLDENLASKSIFYLFDPQHRDILSMEHIQHLMVLRIRFCAVGHNKISDFKAGVDKIGLLVVYGAVKRLPTN